MSHYAGIFQVVPKLFTPINISEINQLKQQLFSPRYIIAPNPEQLPDTSEDKSSSATSGLIFYKNPSNVIDQSIIPSIIAQIRKEIRGKNPEIENVVPQKIPLHLNVDEDYLKQRPVGRRVRGDKLPNKKHHATLEQEIDTVRTSREQRRIRRDLHECLKLFKRAI